MSLDVPPCTSNFSSILLRKNSPVVIISSGDVPVNPQRVELKEQEKLESLSASSADKLS